MNRYSAALILFLASIMAHAQCLTDFTKLVPDPSVDFSSDFGRSIAMYDQYMAIGVPNSDSLGRLTGIVYIYEKVNFTWEKIASLAPSDPVDAMQFGTGVTLSENYLLVSSRVNGGKVYIFKKGPGGWTSQTELSSLSVSGSFYFGINPYGNQAIAIAEDEQTVAITDVFVPITASNADPYYMGAVYVYHKLPLQEWNSPIIPQRLIAPRGNIADFGRAGVALKDNHLVTGSPFTADGGNLFIFHAPSGFSNYTLQATLSPRNNLSYFLGGFNIVITSDGIFTHAGDYIDGQSRQGILYYQKPMSGTWEDATPTCSFLTIPGSTDIQYGNAVLTSNGTDLLVSAKSTVGDGYFNLIKKGITGWCTPVYQNIDYAPGIPGPFGDYGPYGTVIACNQQTDAVLGFVPIPDNNYATIALKTFSNEGTQWKSTLLYPKKKSTAGHFYGGAIVGYDNHLFVGATNDGTNVPGVGAVYYYEKQGNSWNMKSKILAPSTSRFDDNFGSALAYNKEYLAVGADGFESGHSASGRVFIYKKAATGWEASELVQEIALPEDRLIVYAYGDNLAMTDKWLIIPYVQNNPYRIMMAIYKLEGTEWIFYQSLETAGGGNFFAKSTTVAVSIENETLLAGNIIFEINTEGQWEARYTLYPSDPESIQISPDFTYWVSNGSSFGHSNSIKDNTIFIGAPLKDHGATWDVGAVYVYTKEPGEPWSSRTETTKILPRVTEEGELFGYSLKNSGNTILVGAPGADFYKDGATARNKPGRAYVFQAKDYFWQDVVKLIDITGDSFKKDYYGVKVYMDNSDFFISASIEDLATGQLSGSVYVTPSPPIIKLVPPACFSAASIDLFGYPFGGTWTGPGIIDAAEGIFNPKIAGIGIHEFRYRTPSCTYEGILRIEVENPPTARLITPSFFLVCENKSFSITIEVEPEDKVNYLWYFRSNASQTFAPLEIRTPVITATVRGEYQLKAYTKSCEVLTPVITIGDEEIEIVIDSPFRTCERNSIPVQLVADPPGGTWVGPGISNNQLVATNLGIGIYKATYTYVSPAGCIYTEDGDVMVIPAPVPVIDRALGNLCNEGSVTLQISAPVPGATYTWLFKSDGSSNKVLGNSVAIEVDKHGSYSVIGDYDVCTINSLPIIINDQLKVTIEPAADFTEVCAEDKLNIIISEPLNATFTWLFSPSPSEALTVLMDDDNMHEVSQSGYYQVAVTRGVCNYESELKQIMIQPRDSVFVPNVFTPNGDGSNEIFKLVGSTQDANLVILNRYGDQMFEGPALQGWTGGNASAGVYYWMVQYLTCRQEQRAIKGTVQLIR